MIYSYKQDSVEELLRDHIEEMLKVLNTLTTSKALKFVEKFEIPKADFINSLKIAVIFHDIGKIFYQENWKEQSLSFIGHERISALFLKMFMKNLDDEEPIIRLKDAIIFAVLYHHHAMGYRLPAFKEISTLKLNSLFEEFYEDISHLMRKYKMDFYINPLHEMILEIKKNFLSSMENIHSLIRYAENLPFEKDIWETYLEDGIKRTLMLLSLSILISLDYESAGKTRRGNKAPFHRVTKEFIRHYLQ